MIVRRNLNYGKWALVFCFLEEKFQKIWVRYMKIKVLLDENLTNLFETTTKSKTYFYFQVSWPKCSMKSSQINFLFVYTIIHENDLQLLQSWTEFNYLSNNQNVTTWSFCNVLTVPVPVMGAASNKGLSIFLGYNLSYKKHLKIVF